LTLDGPGNLSLRYLLFDTASGEIIQQGDAETLDANWFAIRMTAETTAELELGIYELVLVAYSDELARMAERRIELEADITIIEEELAPEEEAKPEADDEEDSATEEASADTESDSEESDTESDSEAASESDETSDSESAAEPAEAEDSAEEAAEEAAGGLPVNAVVVALVVAVIGGGLLYARRRRL
jgi:cobalamin biosynthesis Mg chelatase CobN